jgi:cell wall-associated NlpC family hydrolase
MASTTFRGILAVSGLLVTVFMGGCASTGAVPRPFPMPGASAGTPPHGPESAPPGSPQGPATRARGGQGGADGYAVTGTALALRGAPYLNGGTDPRHGFDCSGFTQYVFAQHGLRLPRDVRDQFHEGTAVKPEDVRAGDLLFFSTTAAGPTHVGIAIGGDGFIHAPSSTGVVRVERLTTPYWSQRFLEARRID